LSLSEINRGLLTRGYRLSCVESELRKSELERVQVLDEPHLLVHPHESHVDSSSLSVSDVLRECFQRVSNFDPCVEVRVRYLQRCVRFEVEELLSELVRCGENVWHLLTLRDRCSSGSESRHRRDTTIEVLHHRLSELS